LSFTEFNLHEQVLEGLSAMNFTKPTPIQEQAIPAILDNKDLIACAQTGTGKTAAYLLPILDKITQSQQSNQINTIILAPTRELALQIDQQLEGFAYFVPVSSAAVYGGGDGASWDQQKNALVNGADIVIATPGRLIAHLNLGYVNVSKLEHLILDEADRMLDMGFYDDIMRIVSQLPKKRQTLLFSATMPHKIRELANKILVQPEQINIAISKPAAGVVQLAYLAYDQQKFGLITHLLAEKEFTSIIIFSSTKQKVKEVERTLQRNGFAAKAIHSDLEQGERETVLRNFKNRETQILIATDILSRGIDIENIDMVINFDVPHDAEDYIHRIGRTARASSTGIAVTFVNEKEIRKFARIEQFMGTEVTKPTLPSQLGEGPVYDPGKKPTFSENGKKRFHKKRKNGKSSGKPANNKNANK
jgi:superfamily II DNA/RNA helicase